MVSRVQESELLDSATAAEAAPNLRDLARINRWLGGNHILAALLRPYLRRKPDATILDAGAANGETLRWLSRRFPRARLFALDKVEAFVREAGARSIVADALQWPIAPSSVDLVICSLFLHHFTDQQVRTMLVNFRQSARMAAIAVDLQRHWMASSFLPATRWLARWHPMTVHDGVISVRAAFTPSEMRRLAPPDATVRSHGPWFRLSVVIDAAERE
jgi:2-polyprenyl-3-methyl-5-hydroxy-6-metoxy-1,4-benzoquinol methylase